MSLDPFDSNFQSPFATFSLYTMITFSVSLGRHGYSNNPKSFSLAYAMPFQMPLLQYSIHGTRNITVTNISDVLRFVMN